MMIPESVDPEQINRQPIGQEMMTQLGVVRSGQAGNAGTWIGFVSAAFCIVGMLGLFATYAAPLPYQRELRRETVLSQVLDTPPAQRAALRDALGDSAGAVLDGPGPIERRVAIERVAMEARFAAEGDATAARLRLEVAMVTLMGALFGGVALAMQRRG